MTDLLTLFGFAYPLWMWVLILLGLLVAAVIVFYVLWFLFVAFIVLVTFPFKALNRRRFR